MTILWPGEPGGTWTNDTSHIVYQLHCAWHNTCGACAQYDLAIAEFWGKFHRGCACISTPIYPGSTGVPYIDWQETISKLSEGQQKQLVGAENWKLIESGAVKWTDVVTPTRVRDLQEVVSREILTVDGMIKSGVRRDVAEKAWASVNTPDHVLAEMHRTDLVQQILKSGITPKTLTEMFGEKMAEKIVIAEGPSGMKTVPGFRDDAAWTKLIMDSFRVPASSAAAAETKAAKAAAEAKAETKAEAAKAAAEAKAETKAEAAKAAKAVSEAEAKTKAEAAKAAKAAAEAEAKTKAEAAKAAAEAKAETAGTYNLTVAGTLSPETVQEFDKLIQAIPKQVLETLEKNSATFVFAEKLIDHLPHLKGVTPRGWPDGTTWESADGSYVQSAKEIVATTMYKIPKTDVYIKSERVAGVLYHETGHGLDAALGRISKTEAWLGAYTKDVANLSDQAKPNLKYFLQSGDAGPSEAFAELFAYTVRIGSGTIDIRDYFPESAKLMESIIKGSHP